jgi:SAM-dependent methyltransferase
MNLDHWTSGYVADLDYTYGYYTELNPLRLQFAFLTAGLVYPDIHHACELGFGQGLSVNFHAAADTARWYGTDFNPAQAGFAQELATISGHGAQLYDDAFAEFCARSDLPKFDFIGLHGIWSWISDANRATLVDFIRRHLTVGGVLYVSYNTQPGWAAMGPLRDLLTEHTHVMGAGGQGLVNRIDAAIAFAEQLLNTNAAYGRANPQIAERLKRIKDQNRHYLAHEYFNRDWQPMAFSRFTDWLAPAKLNFACSAHYPDHIDMINLTAEQQSLLNDLPDPLFRQTVRDFMVNQQFRRDYWVRGARRLPPIERLNRLRQHRIALIQPYDEVKFTITGSLGEANLQEAVYRPLLETLADHRGYTLGQLEQHLQPTGLQLNQILQAVMILIGQGSVASIKDDAQVNNKVRKQAERLNHHLMQRARSSGDIGFLTSPMTGGGIAVSRFQQLFLLARAQGARQPSEWAQFTWDLLQAQGQRIIKDGQTLDSAEANLAELTTQAQRFADVMLPIMKTVQLI